MFKEYAKGLESQSDIGRRMGYTQKDVSVKIKNLRDEIIFLLEGEVRFKGTIDSLLEHKKETKLERAIAELIVVPLPTRRRSDMKEIELL